MSDYDSIHLNNALICLNVPYLSICLNTMAEYYWMIAPEYPWKACRPARNHCKRFLEVAKLAYATKTKESITSQKLGSQNFWLKVFSAKVNLLYLVYSMDRRCCLLHLTKQIYLLKTFLRILILMTQVSLYLFSLLELIWNCIIFLYLPRWLKRS